MTLFAQATGPELMVSTLLPESVDVRAEVLAPLRMTPEQTQRLNANACARYGGTDGLRPGGLAYTASGPDGIVPPGLAWHVQVCRDHAATGGTW